MLREVPSWVLYMSIWEVISTIAYTLTFALLETLALFLPVILIALILPKRWTEVKFVPLSSALLVELALMAIGLHAAIMLDKPKRLLLLSYACVLGVTTFLVLKFPKIESVLRTVAERLMVLSFIYIFFDIIGLLIVLVRNI
jgi:hypothetical protein